MIVDGLKRFRYILPVIVFLNQDHFIQKVHHELPSNISYIGMDESPKRYQHDHYIKKYVKQCILHREERISSVADDCISMDDPQ